MGITSGVLANGTMVKNGLSVLADGDERGALIVNNGDPSSGGGVDAPLGTLCIDYSTGSLYQKTGAGDTAWAAAGSGDPNPSQNILYVDSAASEVTGVVYQTLTDAISYITSSGSPGPTNKWLIDYRSKEDSSNGTLPNYVKVRGSSQEAVVKGTWKVDDSRSIFTYGLGEAWNWPSFENITLDSKSSDTGDTSSGSAVVTNLSDTSGLEAGDAVSGSGIPDGTIINTVDSATQITLSNNATATATGVTLYFGGRIDIVDDTGAGQCNLSDIVMRSNCGGLYISTATGIIPLFADRITAIGTSGSSATTCKIIVDSTVGTSSSILIRYSEFYSAYIEDKRSGGNLLFDSVYISSLGGPGCYISSGANVSLTRGNLGATLEIGGTGAFATYSTAGGVPIDCTSSSVTLQLNNTTVSTLQNTGSATVSSTGDRYIPNASSSLLEANSHSIINSLDSRTAHISVGGNTFPSSPPASTVTSVALGDGANANPGFSVSIGDGAAVSSLEAIAVGNSSLGVGLRAIAIGSTANAGDNQSVAMGYNARANDTTGTFAVAIGGNADADASSGVAIGSGSSVTGSSGVAVGASAAAIGNSVAIGNTATITSAGDIAIGTASSATSGMAIGSSANSDGGESIALGQSADAGGTNSIAIGNAALANDSTGSNAIAIGGSADVDVVQGIGIGDNASVTSNYSIAVGHNTSVSGEDSIVIGEGVSTSLPDVTVIKNPFLLPEDDGTAGTSDINRYATGKSIISTELLDVTTTSTSKTITFPSGMAMYVDRVVVFVAQLGTYLGSPTISAGITGDTTKFVNNQVTTLDGLRKRHVFDVSQDSSSKDAVTSLTFDVDSAGSTSAGVFEVRVYWEGVIVENDQV